MEINKKIEELLENYNLVVLKGFKLKEQSCDVKQLINKDQRMNYFFHNIFSGKKKVLYFEEYLLLKDLLKGSSNNKIAILNNNIYINYYPLIANLDSQITKALLGNRQHDEDIDDEEFEIDDLEVRKYTDVYSELIKLSGKYYCIYNVGLDNYIDGVETIEEEYIDFYTPENLSLKENTNSNIDKVVITDEIEYISFLDQLDSQTPILCVEVAWSPERIKKRLQILNSVYNIQIEIFGGKEDSLPEIKEVHDILKKYWGYDSFKKLKVYNAEKLENKITEVNEVSQEQIIKTIIYESENAYKSQGRDVFVTAPTGAGKSVIFQIPAIYLTEKYDRVVVVISPLIGLMRDQITNLTQKGYNYARTLNSDISLTEKNNILEEIRTGACRILYVSPETLIGNSMLDGILQNDKKLGLLVVDEAHIVTTWGKQFRPDYWYLGDYITKIRKKYQKQDGNSFIIATFTATATYAGEENMFEETKSSLNMINPHKYFGFIRRDNISFDIQQVGAKTDRREYEKDKFDLLIKHIKRSLFLGKKCLIYFPTIVLIERFKNHLCLNRYDKYVVTYHGQLKSIEKKTNEQLFKSGQVKVMIATKAFGMGIDINDIEVVIHFAPTGNLCDYLQEVGRAGRKPGLEGVAKYDFMKNDFKYINRFHGLSILKKYQLVEVIKKIYSIYKKERGGSPKARYVRKRNEMLVDVGVFSHIFENPFFGDEDDILNKVKTALLVIQKDFETKKGYSPFTMRPIPLFAKGYFKIDRDTRVKLEQKFTGGIFEKEKDDIYRVNLKQIWENDYSGVCSFPQFKYYVYSKNEEEIPDTGLLDMIPCLKIEVEFENHWEDKLENIIDIFETVVNDYLLKSEYLYKDKLKLAFTDRKIKSFRAEVIAETLLNNLPIYAKNINQTYQNNMYTAKTDKNGVFRYRFLNGIDKYISWLRNGVNDIRRRMSFETGTLYTDNPIKQREILQLLGIYEAMELLTFKSIGGDGGEIYIYVNETKTIEHILNNPYFYKNTLLEKVDTRHMLNVIMLDYLYSHKFSSDEIWNIIENYFLGELPQPVTEMYTKKLAEKASKNFKKKRYK